MFKKYLFGFSVFALAFVILSVSVMEAASVSYVFATPLPEADFERKIPVIEYQIPYEGKVGPDSPLWTLKVIRDKAWYAVSSKHLRKAELALLFSDKRIGAAKILFENKKPDIGLSTLSKGEKYLEIAWEQEELARKGGVDTSAFLSKLSLASLKHRQIIEEILPLSPEDAKPQIIKIEDYSKNIYKNTRDALNSKGISAPKNPFDGE